MGKAPVLIKINSNKNRFLLLQSFPVCRGIFPRHILKEAAESTHTFKAQITDISLMLCEVCSNSRFASVTTRSCIIFKGEGIP